MDWLIAPIKWTGPHKAILLAPKPRPIPDIKLNELIEKSKSFPIKFPVETIRCQSLEQKVSTEVLEKNINSAYPVIHEYALYLCSLFLNFQKTRGVKQDFYKDMTILDLIDRILTKRAVIFLSRDDEYLLVTGEKGAGNWENIGTDQEKSPLVIENCLSYDEVKLSALLSVSSHSFFINEGDRLNRGKYEQNREKVEEHGVIVGLVGPRFEKRKVMEYKEILKTDDQNIEKYGYGQRDTLQYEFSTFYGDCWRVFQEMEAEMSRDRERYADLAAGRFFDRLMYSKRLAISFDTLLLEANERAKKENKKAYIHVVGLGLGVWKTFNQQNSIFLQTFVKRIELLSGTLTNVSDVRFAYVHETNAGPYQDGDQINHIKIHIVDKNPQIRLVGKDEGKLLVVSYPWDGNALPGNEFWAGSLSGSGDPAAASCSQIAELHNGHINGKLMGANLRVATSKGVFTFFEYQDLHKDD